MSSVDLEDRGQALENEYFRNREKEIIAKMKARIEAENSRSLDLKCPKCDGTLVETDFEDIKIDVCNKCSGVWLDAGELTQVVHSDKDTGWFGKLFA
jgi:ribosomal protein L37AE/L43A